MISQAVVGELEEGDSNLCRRVITADNWQDVSSVPIYAKMDLKRDGDQTSNLIVWLTKRVNGEIKEKRSVRKCQVL